MRELKFRAWDKLQNKFLYPWPDGFTVLGETTCFDLIGQQLKEFTPKLTTIERLGDVIITQYTGLKDRTGKEIYEGDIIRYKTNTDIAKDKFFNAYVYFSVSTATNGFRVRKSTWSKLLSKNIVFNNEIEIIGNIYENTELLKENK